MARIAHPKGAAYGSWPQGAQGWWWVNVHQLVSELVVVEPLKHGGRLDVVPTWFTKT